MKVIKPPTKISKESIDRRISIALFGSIEMGTAANWQAIAENQLEPYDVDVYNPRRDNWDPKCVQSIDNPQFKGQVEWELTALENVGTRLFYFDPNTKSPITLMELGLGVAVGHLNTVVCCPEGFWRKGNVDIVCERYGFKNMPTLEDLLFEGISLMTFSAGLKRVINPVEVIPDEIVEPLPFAEL